MPLALSSPGVYVQEDLSGPRLITGIQPSITAFVGRTRKGPVGTPVTVHNFGEFITSFGSFWSETWLPEAVRDFFLNGGSTAIVVRAVHSTVPAGGGRTPTAVAAKAAKNYAVEEPDGTVTKKRITLTAKGPGVTMNGYRMQLRRGGYDSSGAPIPRQRFTLEITLAPDPDGNYAVVETYVNQTLGTIVGAVNGGSLLVDAALSAPAGGDPSIPADLTVPERDTFAGGLDGDPLDFKDFTDPDDDPELAGALTTLERIDLFSMLVIPPTRPALADNAWGQVIGAATEVAVKRRAFLIVDGPAEWNLTTPASEMEVDVFTSPSPNAALYTPWSHQVQVDGSLLAVPPSGAIAGIYARTDGESGVWKAPAGVDSSVLGAVAPARILTTPQNGDLNIKGINCLMRKQSRPVVVWGARTQHGFDGSGSPWRYVPVRRLFNFVEETLHRNTEWVVFRENDETLWFQVKASIEAFLHGLFLQGAFQGIVAEQAYYVEVGWSTMTQADIDNGIINITVGIAPVKPAEFVVLTFRHIQQTI